MNEINQPSSKKKVYSIVTDQVIAQLEKGVIPGANRGLMQHSQKPHKRTTDDPYGSSVYSTEEGIADMGSCYLTSFAGIAPKALVNSVAYIQGWLEKLKDNKRILIYAAHKRRKERIIF